jgi:phosphatidate cytidylyltransferase
MLRTRLWMGAVLIALTACVLFLDRPPWYPFLLALLVVIALAAACELYHLLRPAYGVRAWPILGGVLAVVLANWPAHLWGGDPWHYVAGTFAAVVLAAFLAEMAVFSMPGGAVVRIALVVWTAAYLGVLPSFLAQLRWLPGGVGEEESRGAAAVALAVFVPKSCDIGAYFTGRLLGRHRMAPVLSPKKTWEGMAGGLVLSAGVAIAMNLLLPSRLLGSDLAAASFGLAVGGAGALGDLAESLLKRDCGRKDASQVVPGFGGVLDVVDAIVFAAPVAYGWVCWLGSV